MDLSPEGRHIWVRLWVHLSASQPHFPPLSELPGLGAQGEVSADLPGVVPGALPCWGQDGTQRPCPPTLGADGRGRNCTKGMGTGTPDLEESPLTPSPSAPSRPGQGPGWGCAREVTLAVLSEPRSRCAGTGRVEGGGSHPALGSPKCSHGPPSAACLLWAQLALIVTVSFPSPGPQEPDFWGARVGVGVGVRRGQAQMNLLCKQFSLGPGGCQNSRKPAVVHTAPEASVLPVGTRVERARGLRLWFLL